MKRVSILFAENFLVDSHDTTCYICVQEATMGRKKRWPLHLMLGDDLKQVIQQIARDEDRDYTKTVERILKIGIDHYPFLPGSDRREREPRGGRKASLLAVAALGALLATPAQANVVQFSPAIDILSTRRREPEAA